MAEAPTSAELAVRFPFDPVRAAVDSIRGFDWQRWLTVKAWLDLSGEEAIWIEWGEDFTIADGRRVMAAQAKDTSAAISLGQERVRNLIEIAVAQPAEVTTVIWTRSAPIIEARNDTLTSGIALWSSAVAGGPLKDLRSLIGKLSWKQPIMNTASAATDDELRGILAQVRWITGEVAIDPLRREIGIAAGRRMKALGIAAPGRRQDTAAKLLFSIVSEVSTRPDAHARRLTRADVDNAMLEMNAESFSAILPLMAVAEGASRPTTDFLDDRAPCKPPAVPFSLEWFVFNERSTPLIGRSVETAALHDFCSSTGAFRWWAISGDAGIGKSRIAFDLMRSLGSEWNAGFVDASELRKALASTWSISRPVLIIVDYAALAASEIAPVIRQAAASISNGRVRLLLLERDASGTSELMRRLLDRSSSTFGPVIESRHQEPLLLRPLLEVQEEIIAAWLEAAGAPVEWARLTPERAREVAEIAAGRPLLLGFVAASLAAEADGSGSAAGSLDRLLEPLVAKEISRWMDRSALGVSAERMLSLATVAGLTKGYLGPGWREGELAFIASGDPPRVLTINDGGRRRLPTIREAIAADPSGTIQQSIGRDMRAAAATMGPLEPEADQPTVVDALREFAGTSLVVQPDLVMEYLISRRWRVLPFSSSAVPFASDVALARELEAALKLAPTSALFTLDQLRQEPLAVAAFMRAVEHVPTLIVNNPELLPDHGRKELSRILFNAVLRLGKVKAEFALADRITRILDACAAQWPEDDWVAFRAAKAHSTQAGRTVGEAQAAHAMAAIELSPQLPASAMLSSDLQFAGMLIDAAAHLARQSGRDPQNPKLAAAVRGFVKVVSYPVNDAAEAGEIVDLMFTLSVVAADVRPDDPEPFSTDEAIARRPFLEALLNGVREFISRTPGHLSSRAMDSLRKSAVNLTLGFRRSFDAENAVRARELFDRLPRGKLREGDEPVMRLNVIRNVFLAQLSVASTPASRASAFEYIGAAKAAAMPSGNPVARSMFIDMLGALSRVTDDPASAGKLVAEVIGLVGRDWPFHAQVQHYLMLTIDALVGMLTYNGFDDQLATLLRALDRRGTASSLVNLARFSAAAVLVSSVYSREQCIHFLDELGVICSPLDAGGAELNYLASAIMTAQERWGDEALTGLKQRLEFRLFDDGQKVSVTFPRHLNGGDAPMGSMYRTGMNAKELRQSSEIGAPLDRPADSRTDA